jgi:hypothetical protein
MPRFWVSAARVSPYQEVLSNFDHALPALLGHQETYCGRLNIGSAGRNFLSLVGAAG